MGTFEFAQKYSPVVDEKFRKGSKTDALVNQNYDFIGVQTVKVYSRASVTLNDYNSTSGTPTQKINAMRRKAYAENKEEINAQKRDAYEKRKEPYRSDSGNDNHKRSFIHSSH